MASLDWPQCAAVESIPGKRSGAWVFKGTRTPVGAVFENLQDMGVEELVEEFGVTRAQARARGWEELENGDSLTAAEASGVDVLVTTDKNIR